MILVCRASVLVGSGCGDVPTMSSRCNVWCTDSISVGAWFMLVFVLVGCVCVYFIYFVVQAQGFDFEPGLWTLGWCFVGL